MISLLGPAFLLPYKASFYSTLSSLLRGSTPSQSAYSVVHQPIHGVPQANDHPLAMKAVDVLTSSLQVLSNDLSNLDILRSLWTSVSTFLTAENSPEDVTSCYSFASTLLEVYDELAAFVVQSVLPMLPITAEYHDEYCRANTFYLLSLIIRTFPREVEESVPAYAELLREGMDGERGDVRVWKGKMRSRRDERRTTRCTRW